MYRLFLFFFFSACVSTSKLQVNSTLPAESIIPIGRTELEAGKLELISSGAYFGFTFQGKSCSLYVSIPSWLERNYIQYTIDGKYGERIQLTKDTLPVVITAGSNGWHEVWIYKTTEAHTGGVLVNKIVAPNIRSIQPEVKPLMEFIGNSITCGAAADPSAIPCGQGSYHDQHNAYYAYGPRVARALGAHFILNSVSGIGIYRNWNSNGPDMPDVYEQNHFRAEGKPYTFTKFQPAIISIALGTNDLSNGDGKTPRLPFDSATYVRDYVKFV
ncbi:MAG: SGNH/GDSL hydrolase family protein, partial [Flavisolibacter sp.]